MPEPSLSLSDWNWAELMLTQALIGAISPNFRMVELAFEDSRWVVRVTLRAEDVADREEIEDVCDEMGIFLGDIIDRISPIAYARVDHEIVVSTAPVFLTPQLEPRVVFKAREA